MSASSPVLKVIPSAGNRLKVSTSTMRLGVAPGARWSMKVQAPNGSAVLQMQQGPQINFRGEQSLLNLTVEAAPIAQILMREGGFVFTTTGSSFSVVNADPGPGTGNNNDVAYNTTTGGWLQKTAGAWIEFTRTAVEITNSSVKFVCPDGTTRSALLGVFP